MKGRPRKGVGRTTTHTGLAVLIVGLILFLPACATGTAVSTPKPESATPPTQKASASPAASKPTAASEEGSEQAMASYLVPTITCPSCAARVKASAKKDPGVLDAEVKAQRVTVAYDPAKTGPEKIAEAIRNGGDTVLTDE